MGAKSISEMERVRYLLGLSSPSERELIESEYFENEDAFQEMLTAEDDLVDAYVRGELTGEEQRRFEKSFVNSLRGRDRVQFARAFAGTVSATRSVETKLPGTLLDIFKSFQSSGLLRIATIATVILFVAVLAWLVIDRRRMTDELRELRAESAALSKRMEALQRSSDTERTRAAEIAAQLADLRAQPDKPRHRERRTTATRTIATGPIATGPIATGTTATGTTTAIKSAPHSPDVEDGREKIAMVEAEPGQILVNRSDATLGNTLVNKEITQLPVNTSNAQGVVSLQLEPTRDGTVAGQRADQSNVTHDGVNLLNTFP